MVISKIQVSDPGPSWPSCFYTLADIVLIFWHVSQLPAFLKAAYKDRHISYILKDDQIPSFTSKRILYLQEYMQPVGDLVLPCNTFRMLVISVFDREKALWEMNKMLVTYIFSFSHNVFRRLFSPGC